MLRILIPDGLLVLSTGLPSGRAEGRYCKAADLLGLVIYELRASGDGWPFGRIIHHRFGGHRIAWIYTRFL